MDNPNLLRAALLLGEMTTEEYIGLAAERARAGESSMLELPPHEPYYLVRMEGPLPEGIEDPGPINFLHLWPHGGTGAPTRHENWDGN